MRTRPTLRRSSSPSRRQAASCRSRVSTRSRASPPCSEGMDSYRRWGVESAALDLALRQARKPLWEVLGREPQPVTFVSSMRLGSPPRSTASAPARALSVTPLQARPDELDWDERLVADLVATGAVDSVDLKGQYKGTRSTRTRPGALPLVAQASRTRGSRIRRSTPETEPALEPYHDRITWDAPIHSVADIEALPFPPQTINIKPSRFGQHQRALRHLRPLRGAEDRRLRRWPVRARRRRGQNQYLASLFHPGAPNDLAPAPATTRTSCGRACPRAPRAGAGRGWLRLRCLSRPCGCPCPRSRGTSRRRSGCASACTARAWGTRISRTPFSYDASIWSSLTPAGSDTLRENATTRRSKRK